jgi:Fur family transcriptional regulator, ferric uptake regulator
MRLTANRIAGLLREQGYRLTPQRHAVLKALAASHECLTPAAILEKAREFSPEIGRVTVYRTLDILSTHGLVCRVHAPDGCRAYTMTRPSGHHHHLVCSECGATVDFSECDLRDLEERLARETGFELTGHLLEFYGMCPKCRSHASR